MSSIKRRLEIQEISEEESEFLASIKDGKDSLLIGFYSVLNASDPKEAAEIVVSTYQQNLGCMQELLKMKQSPRDRIALYKAAVGINQLLEDVLEEITGEMKARSEQLAAWTESERNLKKKKR